MGIILSFVLWVTALSQSVPAPQHAANSQQPVESVKFCDVIRQAAKYNGKMVEVAGTYATSMDGNSFFDGDCGEARATFPGDAAGTLQAFRKLADFLKHHKTTEAGITVVALFVDGHSVGIARAEVPPYTFEVKRLIAISPMKFKPQREHWVGAPLR